MIDKIADFDNPLMITDKGIIKIPIEVFGNAVQYTTAPAPKFSNGKKIEGIQSLEYDKLVRSSPSFKLP